MQKNIQHDNFQKKVSWTRIWKKKFSGRNICWICTNKFLNYNLQKGCPKAHDNLPKVPNNKLQKYWSKRKISNEKIEFALFKSLLGPDYSIYFRDTAHVKAIGFLSTTSTFLCWLIFIQFYSLQYQRSPSYAIYVVKSVFWPKIQLMGFFSKIHCNTYIQVWNC